MSGTASSSEGVVVCPVVCIVHAQWSNFGLAHAKHVVIVQKEAVLPGSFKFVFGDCFCKLPLHKSFMT